MSALAEIHSMIEDAIAAQPHLDAHFEPLAQRVAEMRIAERQLEADHRALEAAYQNLFIQFAAQTAALAAATSHQGTPCHATSLKYSTR